MNSRDKQIIATRNEAWNKRPVRSLEMYAKTSFEHKVAQKVKAKHERSMKTYHGKKEQQKLQSVVLSKDFSKSPMMQSTVIKISKISF